MTRPGQVDTAAFGRVTAGDIARWAFAFVLVAGAAGAGSVLVQRWSPPALAIPGEEPAILIDLAPVPEPVAETPAEPEIVEPEEPTAEEQPAEPEPPPVVEPEPEPPAIEPPPPEPLVEPPPPPIVDPEPEPAPLPEPEPQPEPQPEPEPEEQEEIVADVPAPVTMSAELRRRREETPITPRTQPRREPEPPTAEPAQRPRAAAAQPAAAPAASRISPEEWQSQVLRQLDQRKVYPRDARQRGEAGSVLISFSVDGSGRISGIGVARSSGFPSLDQAAVDTARQASPLPAPPTNLVGRALSATIRFALR